MNKKWPNHKSKWIRKRRQRSNLPNFGKEAILFYRKENETMSKFWDLFKTSVIVQGTVTIVFVGTVSYLYATGQEIPSTLIQFTSVVLGYYFGVKTQQAVSKRQ